MNDAHKQVAFHAKGILLEAKRAGDALLAAKREVKHGEFKAWVEANCRCSYRSAREYMQVSKLSKTADFRQFDGGVRAFLEAHAKPRVAPPQSTPSLTVTVAERALNIQARVERGEGAERAVAAAKLATLAAEHGMAPEALLERSEVLCPDRGKTVYEAEFDAEEAEEAEVDAELKATEERIAQLEAQLSSFKRREDLITKLMDLSKEELAEQLADALLRLEA